MLPPGAFKTLGQLADALKGRMHISQGSATVRNPEQVRGVMLDRILASALDGDRVELRATARWLIQTLAPQMGIRFCRWGEWGQVQGHATIPGTPWPAAYNAARAFFQRAERDRMDILTLAWSGGLGVSRIVAITAAAAIQEGFNGTLHIPEANGPSLEADLLLRVTAATCSMPPTAPWISYTLQDEVKNVMREGEVAKSSDAFEGRSRRGL